MRIETIEQKIYKFEELPEKTQQKIIDSWRDNDSFFWHSEFVDTLEALETWLDVAVKNWECDQYSFHFSLKFNENNDENKAYRVVNAILDKLNSHTRMTARVYLKHYPKIRYSKIFKAYDNCPFTGVCYDYAFTTAIEELRKPENFYSWDYSDFCNHVFNSLFTDVKDEYHYWHSEECIVEEINSNDYEFTEGGEIY